MRCRAGGSRSSLSQGDFRDDRPAVAQLSPFDSLCAARGCALCVSLMSCATAMPSSPPDTRETHPKLDGHSTTVLGNKNGF